MITNSHQYPNLNLSPWPLMSSLTILNLALSVINMTNFSENIPINISIMMLIISSMIWWNTLNIEMNNIGYQSKNLENSYNISIILFISSEVLFFVSIFWAYQHFSTTPIIELGCLWPPISINIFNYSSIPSLNTIILLTSGLTVTIAHNILINNNINNFINTNIATVILGLLFTIIQYQEYNNSFFSFSDGVFGSTFFIITGLHGMHVVVGITYLALNTTTQINTNSSMENLSFEVAAWYWHFVDVVWLIVFYILYFINS